jgi:hypothetical protein
MKARICRELDRLELLLKQIKAVEKERDTLIVAQAARANRRTKPRGSNCSWMKLQWQVTGGPGRRTEAEPMAKRRQKRMVSSS